MVPVGRDEDSALAVLAAGGPRHERVAVAAGLAFTPPSENELRVVERVEGNAAADFGGLARLAEFDALAAAALRLRLDAAVCGAEGCRHALDHAWELEDRLAGW